jgi:geranylgeranylglycerol-phosphate geranylgeranyltransferase
MAAVAVGLGAWIGRSALPAAALAALCIAAAAATAFGNAVNDLHDVATDRISHPDRPLPHGDLSERAAGVFALSLALLAVGSAASVSRVHLLATVVPLALLLAYARFLKATPLAGNITVSLLVAYPLLYGALASPGFHRLLLPALAAFLANMLREIVKDLQDEPGDRAAGLVTTAALPHRATGATVIVICVLFLGALPLPVLLRQFGLVYAILCLAVIAPMHLFWMAQWLRRDRAAHYSRLSGLLKIELVLGLFAMAADRLL